MFKGEPGDGWQIDIDSVLSWVAGVIFAIALPLLIAGIIVLVCKGV